MSQDTQGQKDNIPVIDITSTGQKVADALVEAAGRYGFVFIRYEGSGIPASAIKRTFDQSKNFFASSQTEKKKCTITANNRGWSSMHSETLDPEKQRVGDFKEAFNFGEFVNGQAQQPLPESLAPHEAELSEFAGLCHDMCMKLLKLFALGLKVDPAAGGEDWFASRHDPARGPSGSILRLLHYPALSSAVDYDPAVDIRAGAHSDYGSITLLFQQPSQPGLEILAADSRWVSVPVYPTGTERDPSTPILVNIGDLLSYWTNGLLKSTVHRVIFPKDARRGGEDRYSMAYFCHPVNTTALVPVPSEMVKKRAASEGSREGDRAVLTAEEHLNSRLAATYGWSKIEDGQAD